MAGDNLYLDANILIDIVLERATNADSAAIISKADRAEVHILTSPVSLHLIEYASRKYFDRKYLQAVILGMLNQVKLISISQEMAKIAVAHPLTDIEDSLHYYTALEHNCNYFISNDKKLAKKGLVILPVLSPGEYLKIQK